jgi:hypothetical protein
LPGFLPNDRQEHHFDDLGPNQQYHDIGVDRELLNNLGAEDEDEDEGEGEDEDIEIEDIHNLPHERNPPEPEEQQPGLLWGNRHDPDEEPNPNDPMNPAEYCAAFREHPLIRNTYVDAVIQKVRHSASHLSLIDHLKASQRQLHANPNVPVDELAKMAVMIRTVTR